jgi:hypothetical protein
MVESTLAGSIADANDYFTFAVDKGVVYTVNLWNTTPVTGLPPANGIDVDAEFVGATGSKPLLASSVGPNSSIYPELTPTDSGVVNLHLRPATGGVSYRLSVVSSLGVINGPPTFEPNNSPSSAAPFTLGMAVETELNAAEDSVDFFSVPVLKDRFYAFAMTVAPVGNLTLSGSLNPDVGPLFDVLASGSRFAGTTTYGDFQAVATGSMTFRFALSNALSPPPQTGFYKFIVYPSTADGLIHDTNYEPNNTIRTAAPVQLGAQIVSSLNNTDDNVDCFQIPVTGGMSYVLTVSNTCALSKFNVSGLVDGVSVLIEAPLAANTANLQRPFAAQLSGTFVVKISQVGAVLEPTGGPCTNSSAASANLRSAKAATPLSKCSRATALLSTCANASRQGQKIESTATTDTATTDNDRRPPVSTWFAWLGVGPPRFTTPKAASMTSGASRPVIAPPGCPETPAPPRW